MGATAPSGLTWTELQSWPEDGKRYELIDGELVVSPAPGTRHQRAVVELVFHLKRWENEHGGQVLAGPFDVYVHERQYTEPDVLYVRPERTHLFEAQRIAAPPDLLVEISSPSTRRRDLGAKRDLYERFGVAEYWFVDLEEERVVVHVLTGDRYEEIVLWPGEVLEPLACPGLAIPVEGVLGPGD